MSTEQSKRLARVHSVQVMSAFVVRLGLTDGTARVVDLEPLLRGPIFEPIRNDPALFQAVTVDHRAGTIVWANGADIDPDVLCEGLKPSWDTVATAGGQSAQSRSE